MPIYMDRHDISETVTAENVAQLHQEDLKIQHHFGCRGLTYWFDDKRKTAFCLIEAPDAAAIHKMHDQAHGQVPHSIIEVDATIVESFLGRIGDPEKAQDTALNIINDPAFRTIMVMTLQQPGPLSNAAAVINILDIHEGKSVKHADHNYLISFKSVSNAVHAALAIQTLFKHSQVVPKIALSAGVPVTEKKSIFEDTIKLAERMSDMVKGKIIVTAEVKELYKSENANTFSDGENILALTQAEESFLTLLMDYLDTAWSDTNLKVDDLSKPARCSKSQLYRKIIALTGKSPNTLIRDYRLKEALKLLNKKTTSISGIAFETGFSSPSYFSKCFHKRYGRLPSDHLLVNGN